MSNTPAPVPTGTAFVNGTGLHSNQFAWSESLTVVRLTTGYGVTRYVVTDKRGRHGYAY